MLDSLAGFTSIVIILVGGIMAIKGWLSLSQLVIFNSYIWALTNPMRMVGGLASDIQRFAASGEKVIALLDTEPKIKNIPNSVKKEKLKGIVEFKNVSFSYEEEKVLENVSFKVKPGQNIAVIGPTGSGKSTLVNLICRFYDCSVGRNTY